MDLILNISYIIMIIMYVYLFDVVFCGKYNFGCWLKDEGSFFWCCLIYRKNVEGGSWLIYSWSMFCIFWDIFEILSFLKLLMG